VTIIDRPLAPAEERPTIDVIGWILRLAVCGVFVAVGFTKFESHSMWVALFARIGLGDWFRYFTGALQILGGVLFLLPKTRYVGAALVGVTMVGAVLAHLFVLGTGVFGAVIPFALLMFVVVVTVRAAE
jgi:putative oxidoreductase